MNRIYVTYDLQQTPGSPHSEDAVIVRGAKEVLVSGPVLQWEVGEFSEHTSIKAASVRVKFLDPSIGQVVEIITVPAHSHNVHLHLNSIPEEYRSALKNTV